MRKSDWKDRLAKRAKVRKEDTQKRHVEVTAKRAARRKKKVPKSSDKPLVPSFGPLGIEDKTRDCGQTQKKVIGWFLVQGWFRSAIIKTNPAWLVTDHEDATAQSQSWWTWAEKNCAERLLKRYGEETVEKTVKWFVANWQAKKDRSDGRLEGAPTVNLLWVSRERIFSDAKEGIKIKPPRKRKTKKHMVGEYDDAAANKLPRVGWGDV